MSSKFFLLLGFLVVAFLITSKVSARDLAETSDAHNEVKGVKDAKYGGYPGGGGGYPGGGGYQGGGGYPGGGGYQGGGGYPGRGGGGYPGRGYCRYGCCGRHDYRGYCLRCCGVESQVEAKPHN